jgi:acyl carrier protein
MSSLKALQDLIHEKYDIALSDLDPQASMRDKGLDSLALAEFIFAVEDHFGIVVPDDDPSIDTLGGLAAVVDKALADKALKAGAASAAASTAASASTDSTATAPAAAADPATAQPATAASNTATESNSSSV